MVRTQVGRPATGDRRPATGDRRPATGDRRPATGDRRPANCRRFGCRCQANSRRGGTVPGTGRGCRTHGTPERRYQPVAHRTARAHHVHLRRLRTHRATVRATVRIRQVSPAPLAPYYHRRLRAGTIFGRTQGSGRSRAQQVVPGSDEPSWPTSRSAPTGGVASPRRRAARTCVAVRGAVSADGRNHDRVQELCSVFNGGCRPR